MKRYKKRGEEVIKKRERTLKSLKIEFSIVFLVFILILGFAIVFPLSVNLNNAQQEYSFLLVGVLIVLGKLIHVIYQIHKKGEKMIN